MASFVIAMVTLTRPSSLAKPQMTYAAGKSAAAFASSRMGPSRLRGGVATMSTLPAAAARDLMGTALMTPSADVTIAPAATIVSEWKGDLLIALMQQSDKDDAPHAELSAELSALDVKLEGTLAALIADACFKAKAGDTKVITLPPKYGLKKVALVGVGKKATPASPANAPVVAGTKWGGAVATISKAEKAAGAAVALLPGASAAEVQAAVEALYVGLVGDDRFRDMHAEALKTADERKLKLKAVELLQSPTDAADAVRCALEMAKGILLTKALINSPANYVTPTALAKTAERMAAELGLSLEVLEQADCEKLGMGAYLGVSQGAIEPPKFIHLTYKPKGAVTKRLAFVGKGLTFDSGGYNIKAGPGSLIEKMKFDMGGAGAVFGAAHAIGALKPDGVEVHFIVAACENMVSSRAMRPGDILTSSNGKTIEVLNTDAEGRLTLADALVFAESAAPMDAIIDVATLTGAVIIALGDKYAGLWTSSDKLGEAITQAASNTGELLWRMPLAPEYSDQLKSSIADLKNVGGRGGSSISAALFLKEFVKEAPWAHLDIAGTVWNNGADAPTGYGVRTLFKIAADATKTDFK